MASGAQTGHHGAVTGSRLSSAVRRVAPGVAVASLVVLLAATASAAAGGLWNITSVGAPVTADGITIAVIDSGVQADHAALAGRVDPQKDYVGDGKSGDPNGHGTHVAGTAAGGAIGCGGASAPIGVARTARILPVRVLDGDGEGSMGDVAAGIRWAADRGAHVINLSLGPEVGFTTLVNGGGTLADAIEYAWKKGSISVLAAGNDAVLGSLGSGYGDIPAIVVTATTRQERKAYYATSVGSARWGIAAPGGDASGGAGDILSAYKGNQCAYLAGTSMAAPHVAGAVAALRARGLSPKDAVERLLATADDIGPSDTYGAGLLNVGRALEGLGGAPSAAPSSSPGPAPAPAPAPPPAADPGQAAPAPTPDAPASTAAPADPTPSTEVADESAPGSTTTSTTDRGEDEDDGTDESASGSSQIREEGGGRVGAPLAVGAGLAIAALWGLTGRAALRLRH